MQIQFLLEDAKVGFTFCVFTFMNVKHIIAYMLDKYITPESRSKRTVLKKILIVSDKASKKQQEKKNLHLLSGTMS